MLTNEEVQVGDFVIYELPNPTEVNFLILKVNSVNLEDKTFTSNTCKAGEPIVYKLYQVKRLMATEGRKSGEYKGYDLARIEQEKLKITFDGTGDYLKMADSFETLRHDHKYVGYWTRTLSSPKCPHCQERMKEVDDPYGLIWECKECDWTTFFCRKEK
jgi:hypothetical protein